MLTTGRAASAEVVDLVASPLRVLRAVQRDQQFPASPEIGLAVPWLFTAGKGSPSLLQEIRRELASSRSSGHPGELHHRIRRPQAAGRAAADHSQGAQGQGCHRLRILTTTYTGATEARALDELARLPGCEVRVSLDGRRTRLHAKAWLFQRKTGFGSAYIGSANLSGAALTGGLEWTVKLTQRAQEALFRSCDSPLRDALGRQRVPALRPRQRRASAGVGSRARPRVLRRRAYRRHQLLRPPAQDLPAGHAGATGDRARPRSEPQSRWSQPRAPARRWWQRSTIGTPAERRRASSPAVRGAPRGDPAPGPAHVSRGAARPGVRRPADRRPSARTMGPPVRHHRQRDQPRPGGHRGRRALAHRRGG